MLSTYIITKSNRLGKDGVVGSIPIGSTIKYSTFLDKFKMSYMDINGRNESRTWGTFGGLTTRLLCILYPISFLSCCIIAVALTEVRGHVKLGSFTLAYNETTQEYVQAAVPYSAIMMEGRKP